MIDRIVTDTKDDGFDRGRCPRCKRVWAFTLTKAYWKKPVRWVRWMPHICGPRGAEGTSPSVFYVPLRKTDEVSEDD